MKTVVAVAILATFCSLSSAQQDLWHIPVPMGQPPVRMEPNGRYYWEDPATGSLVFEGMDSAMRRRSAEAEMRMRLQEEIRSQVEWEVWSARRRAENMAATQRTYGNTPAVPSRIKRPPINPKAKYPELARMVGVIHENIPDGLSKDEVNEIAERVGLNFLKHEHMSVYYRGKKIYDPKLNPFIKNIPWTKY